MTTPDRRTFTADELELMFRGALSAGDAATVEAALKVMVGVDPRRAVRLFDEMEAALTIASMLRGDRD